jgi:hypothetical protein
MDRSASPEVLPPHKVFSSWCSFLLLKLSVDIVKGREMEYFTSKLPKRLYTAFRDANIPISRKGDCPTAIYICASEEGRAIFEQFLAQKEAIKFSIRPHFGLIMNPWIAVPEQIELLSLLATFRPMNMVGLDEGAPIPLIYSCEVPPHGFIYHSSAAVLAVMQEIETAQRLVSPGISALPVGHLICQLALYCGEATLVVDMTRKAGSVQEVCSA